MSPVRTVFVDTVYWVAIAKPGDTWKEAAHKARRDLGAQVRYVTTDEVLTEFLTTLSGDPKLREAAVKLVKSIQSNSNIRVLPQTRETFQNGLELYAARLDKGYSLTDCISMDSMRRVDLLQVLTNDHHFEQEGFEVLIKSKIA